MKVQWFVEYAGLPQIFLERAGKDIAVAGLWTQATRFDNLDRAIIRASLQWGDEGLMHVRFCKLVDGVRPGPQPRSAKVSQSKLI